MGLLCRAIGAIPVDRGDSGPVLDAAAVETLRGLVARCVAALDPCVRWELDGI